MHGVRVTSYPARVSDDVIPTEPVLYTTLEVNVRTTRKEKEGETNQSKSKCTHNIRAL